MFINMETRRFCFLVFSSWVPLCCSCCSKSSPWVSTLWSQCPVPQASPWNAQLKDVSHLTGRLALFSGPAIKMHNSPATRLCAFNVHKTSLSSTVFPSYSHWARITAFPIPLFKPISVLNINTQYDKRDWFSLATRHTFYFC
jgi:hypothetical protein